MGPDAVNALGREISFEEVCTVGGDQTARRLFASLSHGNAYASKMVDGLATGYLVAIVESICIREMFREMDLTTEVIVGAAVNIRHQAPVPPGKQVWLRGRTTHVSERKATFAVQACDDDEVVCEGVMTFVVTSRERIETRLARKLSADSRRALEDRPEGRLRSVAGGLHSNRTGRHALMTL
jgi:fluoroacetyl-CoA thioesterase